MTTLRFTNPMFSSQGRQTLSSSIWERWRVDPGCPPSFVMILQKLRCLSRRPACWMAISALYTLENANALSLLVLITDTLGRVILRTVLNIPIWSFGLDSLEATWLDGIPNYFLKSCSNSLSKSLSVVFIKSKQTRIFLCQWKVTKIKPIFNNQRWCQGLSY